MRDIDLFQLALGLSSPWRVSRTAFDAGAKQLDIQIDFARGSRFSCKECGAEGCPVHDVSEKQWRHLNFFEHTTILSARVPRSKCDQCGVKQVALPWARDGSGFTLLFEAFVLALVKAMPVANAAAIMGEHDTRIWRILDHYVTQAVDALDLSEVTQIAADETSARRGHDYISLFVDLARRKVVFVTDGKDAATVAAFAKFLEEHGGSKDKITDASIDMGAAFISGVKSNFPNAKITFDKFHVIKLVNEAVDEVRRGEAKNNDWIKGTRHLWLKNLTNLDEGEKRELVKLETANLDTMQAWQMRLNLQEIFKMPTVASARKLLTLWNTWVQVSDLKPMKKVAKTIMEKADDILRAIASKISNGLLEAINGNVQAAKRKAKGYRTKHNLKLIVYLIAGGVLDALPT